MEDSNFMVRVQYSELLPELIGDAKVCEAEQELLLEGTGKCSLQVSKGDIRGNFVNVMVVLNVTDECVYCVEGLSVGPRTRFLAGGQIVEFRERRESVAEEFLEEHWKGIC